MIKKIKNIFDLTKIFFKNSFQNSYIIDKKTNKINKKSIFFWLIILIIIAISYLSMNIIKFLTDINQPTIFLNIFFLLLNIIMIFQISLVSINVYFFSKDLELVLPLPIKQDELLISKFNTILINLYFSELIFALCPLLIYGIYTNSGIIYYLYLFIILLIFPIFINLIVSIVMMFLIKLSKFIKDKDLFQIFITFIFIFGFSLIIFKIGNNVINKIENNIDTENVEVLNNFNNKFENINKYFLIINPIVRILNNYNKLNSILELIKIILFNLVFLILFIFIGKKYYLKNILKNNNKYYLKKINKKNLEKKLKKINKGISYVKKEFKILFKNPIFFMQCIFPNLIMIISIFIIILVALPNLQIFFSSDVFGKEIVLSVDLSVICLVLGIIQIIFTLSNVSITAISREGKNAIYMKYIPIDFYKQFIYKSVPQILINLFLIFLILIFVKLIFPIFSFVNLLFLFILANLLNILNSIFMTFIDLYKPNLNWDADFEAIKNNNNKLFQYLFTISIILLLIYFYKIFSEINLNFACFIIIIIFIIFIFIINKIIKFNINKLLKKIN